MEGKNCFRTKWEQRPTFSGGNIATVAVVPRAVGATAAAAEGEDMEHGTKATTSRMNKQEECLVMACGDTVNVMRAATGEVLCHYTLPVEDVILNLDAVSVLSRHSPAQYAQRQQSSSARLKQSEEVDSKGKDRGKVKATGRKVKQEESVKTEEEEENMAKDAAADLEVPLGVYIAVGTRSLQIYLLRIDAQEVMMPEVLTACPDAEAECQSEGENEEVATAVVADQAEEALGAAAGVDVGRPVIVYELQLLQNWTAAQQAISLVCFSTGGQYLISGSTDGGVKVWNAFHHHLTHNLRCPQASLVQSVYLDSTESLLAVGTFEGHVVVFDFVKKTILASARPHVQAVEALTISATPATASGDNREALHVFSIAGDRRLSVQVLDRAAHTLKETRAIVVKEHVSAAVFESSSAESGGELMHIGAMDGVVTTYAVSATDALRVVRRMSKPPASSAEDANEESLVRCVLVAGKPKGALPSLHGFLIDDCRTPSSLYVADAGFNVSLLVPRVDAAAQYQLDSTLVGFLDQILDIKVLPGKSKYQRVIVNNSKDVRLYGATGCLSSAVLQGHSDVVMSCAVSADGALVATAGKDLEVRFWSTETCQTVAKGVKGHIAEITALAFNTKQTDSYFLLFSISADENLRLWDVAQNVVPRLPVQSEASSPSSSGNTAMAADSAFTHRAGINAAHAGPVYALATAPNDQYVATGGKDKMVNLWNITGKKVYKEATLKGHRRGISSLVFSPVDRMLASAANDGTVRLWSLVSLTCVKTLQVDKTPVLQLAFFNAGTQVVTGNAEGVLRVWAVATSEAVWSSELHEEKIWSLCVLEHGTDTVFLSGSADGVLIATEDYTSEEVGRLRNERHDTILKEQALANAIRKGEFSEAFMLALQLNHPRHLRQVIVKWCAKDAVLCEETLRQDLLPKLTEDQLLHLLQFTREWMTNSRHCLVASLVTRALLAAYHFQDLAKMSSVHALVEPLLAYSQKHSQRQHEVLRRTYYLDYVTRSLDPNALTVMPPFVEGTRDGGGAAAAAESVETNDDPARKRVRA